MRKNCPVVDVNAEIWGCAARLWASLRRRGLTIGDFDVLIAAYCLVYGYTLATCNTKHFKVVPGLVTVDWSL